MSLPFRIMAFALKSEGEYDAVFSKQYSVNGMPAPNQQQRRRKPKSRYGQQLEEKQNLKQIFGVRERQLKNYYKTASDSKEETGPYMISLLERRIDNAVYRSGMAETRPQARQMVSHGLYEVNGRGVDVPSIRLKVGDVISVKESKRKKSLFDNFDKRMQGAQLPSWIELDVKEYEFKITGSPSADEANIGVDIRSVVELFAR